MSILGIVLIALSAAIVGFFIGLVVGVETSTDWAPLPEPNTTVKTVNGNPIKTFNAADLKPKEEVHESVVLSKVVLPKRIKELEYNKRVNAALKEVIDKAVDVWVSGDNKPYKRRLANSLYKEWHAKIDNASYREYRPNLQRLNFIGRRVGYRFIFEAFWESKDPKRDCPEYARGVK